LLLIVSALSLGFLHGLGADHLMAIAALSIGDGHSAGARRSRALGVAMRFALGHAAMLALGAGALVAIGWTIPLVVERGGELLGGALLVLMGIAGLWGVVSGRVYGHSHVHDHEPEPHWHVHLGRRDRHPADTGHSHLPTIVGAAFAVSSMRALAMLTPFGVAARSPLPELLGLIAIFAVGILLSMSVFGIALARVLSARALAHVGRLSGGAVALASLALGTIWIVTSW
jgi:nickel/cobalt exporter